MLASKLKSRKKFIIILNFSLVFLLAIIITLLILMLNKPQEQTQLSEESTTETTPDIPTPTVAPEEKEEQPEEKTNESVPAPIPTGGNCSTVFGPLMVINANYNVDDNYIANRRSQLIDLTATYGIKEANYWNGIPLLDSEAAVHLNDMLSAYSAENQGHSLSTMSCFRSVGTSCGRLCAATGTSDHHTGYTCDLIDTAYGSTLDTDYLNSHPDWQWLKQNSYKYGFIDRYPLEWAGSTMNEPLNVNENGSTGYYETWHYRYVGIPAAYDIATGKYNNGKYDSLEHYLKTTGYLLDLRNGTCK